jgi:hypothetical protein
VIASPLCHCACGHSQPMWLPSYRPSTCAPRPIRSGALSVKSWRWACRNRPGAPFFYLICQDWLLEPLQVLTISCVPLAMFPASRHKPPLG